MVIPRTLCVGLQVSFCLLQSYGRVSLDVEVWSSVSKLCWPSIYIAMRISFFAIRTLHICRISVLVNSVKPDSKDSKNARCTSWGFDCRFLLSYKIHSLISTSKVHCTVKHNFGMKVKIQILLYKERTSDFSTCLSWHFFLSQRDRHKTLFLFCSR